MRPCGVGRERGGGWGPHGPPVIQHARNGHGMHVRARPCALRCPLPACCACARCASAYRLSLLVIHLVVIEYIADSASRLLLFERHSFCCLSLHVSVDSSASSRHLSGRERRSVAEERPPAADFTKKGTPKNTSALCAVVLVHVGHDVAAVDGHGDGK